VATEILDGPDVGPPAVEVESTLPLASVSHAIYNNATTLLQEQQGHTDNEILKLGPREFRRFYPHDSELARYSLTPCVPFTVVFYQNSSTDRAGLSTEASLDVSFALL